MVFRRLLSFCLLILLAVFSIPAQSHIAVPIDDPVYYAIEMAELRGLCEPLPVVKPYSRSVVISTINEILSSDASARLSSSERRILSDAKDRLGKAPKTGFNWLRGVYHLEPQTKNGENFFSGDIGISFKTLVGGALRFEENDIESGTDTWGTAFVNGDVGSNFSFDFNFMVGLIRAPVRDEWDDYYNFYDPLIAGHDGPSNSTGSGIDGPYDNHKIATSGLPTTYFPYTFRKNWDAFVFGSGGTKAGTRERWPTNKGFGYSVQPELSAELFDNAITMRFGRMRREWAAMAEGSSLVFNSYAQPFLGFEATFRPMYWFSLSTLTGVLEYYNSDGLGSAWNSQNAFSIGQMEFNYTNYFHFDIGTSVVWPKRFELGYVYPLANNFFYQNNIGDFDNLAAYFNIKGQYPGLGSLWFSFFADEIDVGELDGLTNLDRQMFAFQTGLRFAIPGLPFSSIRFSYTKIEPYTYTHQRIFAPWYDSRGSAVTATDKALETAYTNNGVGLGYYLPPNSDEFLFRFETRPFVRSMVHLQYQLIRHGAEHGPNQVDGSSYLSELDTKGRSSKKILEKDFLNDGAYQWMHVAKLGGSHTLYGLPITVFCEGGVVYSYYTRTSGNKSEYPDATSLIFNMGFHIFPR